jgi:ADP-ribosylglycohydrolase
METIPMPPAGSLSVEHARGCLLGLAVGDALGTSLAFEPIDAPRFPALATGPHREVTGGGPFGLRPGQVTDDTQMAICIADSLLARRALDVADLRARYVAWMGTAFDIGNQTSATLRAEAASPEEALGASRGHWVRLQRSPAGNGSLMRTAPLAVAFHADRERLIDAALTESAITHFDPRCRLACAAFDASLALAMTGPTRPAAMVDEARRAIAIGRERLFAGSVDDDAEPIRAAAVALNDDLAQAEKDDPDLYGEIHIGRTQGFVRVAFRLAYWELLHASSYEEALVDVVNRGGDADTNGAITGALLGAYRGEAAIPARWRETVLAAPGQEAYSPRRLLELATPTAW